jgi:hypothetical protein
MSNNPLAERESRFRGIVFNHATGTVLASYDRDEERRTVRSLYVRDPMSKDYERLSAPDDRTSYHSPVAARDAPYVFINVMVIGDRGGGNWLHVARVHVPTRSIEVAFTPEDLFAVTKTPREWRIAPWVSDLMRASDDGRLVTCRLGIPEARPDGSFHMNYSIFDLDVAARSLVRLADLDTPYN